jgi:hypothetical protein
MPIRDFIRCTSDKEKTMIEEKDLITPKTAKQAREVGFKVITPKFWCNYDIDESLDKWKLLPSNQVCLSLTEWAAPTKSYLQNWLREFHKIEITPRYDTYNIQLEEILGYRVEVFSFSTGSRIYRTFKTYEEALEKGLFEALKLIKK